MRWRKRVHPNDITIRHMSEEISVLTGLPYDVVKAVLDSIEPYLLHALYEKGLEDLESGQRDKFEVNIPKIGKLRIFPVKYPKTDQSILDGWAIRTKFEVKESFLEKARHAYYSGEDPLLDTVMKNFSDLMITKFKNLIGGIDQDE